MKNFEQTSKHRGNGGYHLGGKKVNPDYTRCMVDNQKKRVADLVEANQLIFEAIPKGVKDAAGKGYRNPVVGASNRDVLDAMLAVVVDAKRKTEGPAYSLGASYIKGSMIVQERQSHGDPSTIVGIYQTVQWSLGSPSMPSVRESKIFVTFDEKGRAECLKFDGADRCNPEYATLIGNRVDYSLPKERMACLQRKEWTERQLISGDGPNGCIKWEDAKPVGFCEKPPFYADIAKEDYVNVCKDAVEFLCVNGLINIPIKLPPGRKMKDISPAQCSAFERLH